MTKKRYNEEEEWTTWNNRRRYNEEEEWTTWNNRRRYNEEEEWTHNVGNSPEQCLAEITRTKVQEKLKKISNWKAPAPEQVRVFRIKH